MRPLDALFSPQCVAVVGASRQPGTIGNEILRNLLRCGFSGVVYPVNPRARAVHAVRAYPNVGAVPDEVDLAVVTVPVTAVLEVAQQCAEAGVKALVVISAGFRETGEAGAEREAELLRICRAADMRLVGPNCLGVINADPEVGLNATFAPTWPAHGRIGFLSQSGALGVAILDYGEELGLGVSTFVSVGNKADVSANDMLEYWADDENTDIVLLYLESFGNPRRFSRIAPTVASKKPIVAVKAGRSVAGRRATSSHTGSLAGVDIAADALFWQTGVIRVDTLEELFNTAMLLVNQPIPRGNGVAILTNAGGPGILAADACEARGLVLPELSDDTIAGLRAFLPTEASVTNPIDMIASASPENFERTLKLVLADDKVDSAVVIYVPPIVTDPSDVAQAIQRGAAGSDKPVLCNFLGTHGIPASLRTLKEGRIPSYAFPETAATSLARAARYGQWLARPKGEPTDIPRDQNRGLAVVAAALERQEDVWLRPTETLSLLEAYGVREPALRVVASPEEAAAAAVEIGFPVALKLASDTITHKSDVHGVRLGLVSKEDVFDAYAGMARRVAATGQSMEAAVVQCMASGLGDEPIELIVGVAQDPAFGPLLMVGLGGVAVEVLGDVAVRVCPLRDIDAREMLEDLKSAPLLHGYRGRPKADTDAVIDVMLKISQLVSDLEEVVEIEINPLMVGTPGRGVLAVDTRVRVARPAWTREG